MNRQYAALSGIAIALILLNHAIHFGLMVSPVGDPWLKVLVFLQALGTFAVPAFLFISGAFLCYAAGELSVMFLRSSLERILWPYVVWSLVFYGVERLSGHEAHSIRAVLKNLAVGYPYHFVPLLAFWYVLAPAVVRVGRKYGPWLVAGIALYQAFLLILRYPVLLGIATPPWAQWLAPPVLFKPMSDWAVYFPLGLVLALHNAAVRPRLLRLRPAFLAATAGLFVIGLLNAYGVVSAHWARFVAPLPLMFVLPTIDRASIPWLPRFEALGRRSYGIYLSHFVVLNVVVWLAAGVPLLRGLPLAVHPALFAVALGGSLMIMDLLARPPLARKAYRYVFGIVPPNRATGASTMRTATTATRP